MKKEQTVPRPVTPGAAEGDLETIEQDLKLQAKKRTEPSRQNNKPTPPGSKGTKA
jgi:hypothetical protein